MSRITALCGTKIKMGEERRPGERQAWEANESVDVRLLVELAGCRIDDGINNDHRRASGEVAQPLPVIAAPRSPKICPRLHLANAWPDLANKASEPSRATSYPLSYLSWQGLAKSAAGSEQMASWLSGYSCGVQPRRRLQRCSAVQGRVIYR